MSLIEYVILETTHHFASVGLKIPYRLESFLFSKLELYKSTPSSLPYSPLIENKTIFRIHPMLS